MRYQIAQKAALLLPLLLAVSPALAQSPVVCSVMPNAWGISLDGNLQHQQLPNANRPRIGFSEV
ncbi:hypothetical protein [Stenotrophomonas sepilia]